MAHSTPVHMPESSALNRVLERHYEPNRRLAEAHGLTGYNCGYATAPGRGSFGDHQKELVFRLLGDVRIGPESVVVDVGSGIGGPAGWIAERYRPGRLFGLEYCWASVRMAQENRGHKVLEAGNREDAIQFTRGDAQRMPWADASVDVIFNLESALHYPDKLSYLRECARVLKPGGWLCLGDITLATRALALPMRISNWIPSEDNSFSHLWTRQQYLDAFRSCGLSLEREENVSRNVVYSLGDGMTEVRQRGFKATKGYRRRVMYLWILRAILKMRGLRYELFGLRNAQR